LVWLRSPTQYPWVWLCSNTQDRWVWLGSHTQHLFEVFWIWFGNHTQQRWVQLSSQIRQLLKEKATPPGARAAESLAWVCSQACLSSPSIHGMAALAPGICSPAGTCNPTMPHQNWNWPFSPEPSLQCQMHTYKKTTPSSPSPSSLSNSLWQGQLYHYTAPIHSPSCLGKQ
jgi:hypothetical protein